MQSREKPVGLSRFRQAGMGRGQVNNLPFRGTAPKKLPDGNEVGSAPRKTRGISRLRNQPTARLDPTNLRPVHTGVMPDLSNILGQAIEDIGLEPEITNNAEGNQSSKEVEMLNYQERKLLESRGTRMERRLPNVEIDMLEFGLFDEEDIRKISVVEVNDASELEGRNRVNDPRMGTLKNDKPCATCERDVAKCSGHFGRITLATPIINPLYRKQLAQVLTCICKSCGGLVVTKESIKKEGIDTLTGEKRLTALASFCIGKPCLKEHNHEQLKGTKACTPNPVYEVTKIVESGIISYVYGKTTRGVLPLVGTNGEMGALEILETISKADLELMGFTGDNHPSKFIMKSLLVIPPCARPPSFRDGYEHPEHLTTMYQDIVRHNNHLATAIKNRKEAEIVKYQNMLTFKIGHMIDNTDKMYTQGTGRVFLSIKDRLQGKEALVRGNMVAKRVNFSARTVITGNPDLKFGQIAVPFSMASVLTFPEQVGPQNFDKLSNLLAKGQVNYIIPGNGKFKGSRLKVNEKIKSRKLELGDVVERWLQNGDYVVINRQPTLSLNSFMGFEVVLWNNSTIGLHLGYTTAFNADFDGDEMNLHPAQSLETAAEFAALLNVKNCILSSQNNRNVMGVVYDALTGSYLMTYRSDIVIDTNDYYDILMTLHSIDGQEGYTTLEDLYKRLDHEGISPMSGRGLFSAMLPPNFFYRKGKVIIKNGVLLSGPITKDHVGPANGSIIQALIRDYGVVRASNFLTDIYFMMNRWLESVGFSIGLDACTLPGKDPNVTWETQKVVEDIMPAVPADGTGKRHPMVEREIQRAQMLVQNFGLKSENPLEEERREKQIQGELDRARGLGVKLSSKLLPENNSLNIMSESKSKGSTYNTAQITGMVGQTYVHGGRIPENISGGNRSLPFFKSNDLTPSARGFIANSFYTGLSAFENFFHLMGTRENLLDTATKTADTGDIHHRIGKMLEDLRVNENGSVTSSDGMICQFVANETGLNPAMLERTKTSAGSFPSFTNLSRITQRINAKYGHSIKTPTQILPYEQELIYQGRRALVVDVGAERVQIVSTGDNPQTITIYRKDIDMSSLKSTNILGPRKYFNQPITSLLPTGSRIEINERMAIVTGYSPTHMSFSYIDDREIHRIGLQNVDFDKAYDSIMGRQGKYEIKAKVE